MPIVRIQGVIDRVVTTPPYVCVCVTIIQFGRYIPVFFILNAAVSALEKMSVYMYV